MSTIDIPGNDWPLEQPAGVVTPPETVSTVERDSQVAEILGTLEHYFNLLYNPAPGKKIPRRDIFFKPLPVTPLDRLPGAEERQHAAYRDMETFQRAVADPAVKTILGNTVRTKFTGFSWSRDKEGSQPVYSEIALLNPNFAVSISFDLDEKGYAVGSKAYLLMSRDPDALNELLAKGGMS
ncbi:MAG TPA: hypothetical protein VFJ84_02050 [Candidatus Saccharimonadales bacterium]|nr:hypothetical protein [Candidatus Saccharimonadales bacterium]